MNDLITIKNTRGYMDKNGVAYLNLEDIACGLGFTRIAASGNEVIRWETVRRYLKEFRVPTSWHDEKEPIGCAGLPEFIPENVFYKLCFKASNPIARAFQDIVTDEILPTIRKTGGYVVTDELFITTYMPYAVESTKQLFRLNLAAVREANKKADIIRQIETDKQCGAM